MPSNNFVTPVLWLSWGQFWIHIGLAAGRTRLSPLKAIHTHTNTHTYMQPFGEGENLCQQHETNILLSTVVQNTWIFTTTPLKLSVASYFGGNKERIGVKCIMCRSCDRKLAHSELNLSLPMSGLNAGLQPTTWVTLARKHFECPKCFVCLFLARQPPGGPCPPNSRGF